MEDIASINSAIIRGDWTSEELESIINAVKFSRGVLARKAAATIRTGDKVKYRSSKQGITVEATVTKIAQKYATVNQNGALWKVPLSMLEAV